MTEEKRNEYIYKRWVVLEALRMLIWTWDLAEPLHDLVNSSVVTQQTIDDLLVMIDKSFNKMDIEDRTINIWKAVESLRDLKKKEEEEQTALVSNQNDSIF